MHLETNMEVFQDFQPLILTITGNLHNDIISNISAYDNSGNQFHLSLNDKIRAEQILWKSKGKKKP